MESQKRIKAFMFHAASTLLSKNADVRKKKRTLEGQTRVPFIPLFVCAVQVNEKFKGSPDRRKNRLS